MNLVNIKVETCRENIKLPEYANQGDAGMDICAAEEILINPGETKIIPTGLKVAIPIGYEIQIRPRSGLSAKTPLRIPNSPGTIDSGYRDEVGVILTNTSRENNGEFLINEKSNKEGVYKICKGDRIAQFVLKEVPVIQWDPVSDISKEGNNRGGGFGSSGIR